MEFISSLTGKSPSMIGFGSEGALTKGPFNALWPVVDLNNALVSAIVTGYAGFTTSAGYVGPHVRVDHDVSLLVPEIWCRMRVAERDPQVSDRAMAFWKRSKTCRCDGRTVHGQPAWAIASRRCSWIAFWAESLKRPARSFRTRCCGRSSRIWICLRRVSTPSSKRSGAWRCSTLRTAAWRRLVRRSKRCCTSWRTAIYQGLGVDAPEIRAMFRAKPCSPATGIRSACAPSRSAISLYGVVTRRRSRHSAQAWGYAHRSGDARRPGARQLARVSSAFVFAGTSRHHRRGSFIWADTGGGLE